MTPSLTADEIARMTQQIWAALLPDDGNLVPGGTGSGSMSATVTITGAWNGTACLTCSPVAARKAAQAMFDMTDEELTVAEVTDAISELINVVGGNIKGVLPGPTELSLPTVHADGAYRVPAGLEPGYRVAFTWLDEPVVVSVWTSPEAT